MTKIPLNYFVTKEQWPVNIVSPYISNSVGSINWSHRPYNVAAVTFINGVQDLVVQYCGSPQYTRWTISLSLSYS